MSSEALMWRSMKPKLLDLCLPVRLENTAAISVPDCALICVDFTVWVELKVVKSGHIYSPKFQYAFCRDMAQRIQEDLFWVILWWDNRLRYIPYKKIVSHAYPKYNVITFDVIKFQGVVDELSPDVWLQRVIAGDYLEPSMRKNISEKRV